MQDVALVQNPGEQVRNAFQLLALMLAIGEGFVQRSDLALQATPSETLPYSLTVNRFQQPERNL